MSRASSTNDTPPSNAAVLRFQVQVNRGDYDLLVARLRGIEPLRARSLARHREITALIDLDSSSKVLAVTRLGKHRLPYPLVIRTGSQTYNHLALAISRSLDRDVAHTVTKHFQEILRSCPEQLPSSIRIEAKDFELSRANHPSAWRDLDTLPILSTIAPTVLLDLDDAPTLIFPDQAPVHAPELHSAIRQSLSDSARINASVSGNSVLFSGEARVPPLPSSCTLELYAHWGSYDELAPAWRDDKLASIKPSRGWQTVHFELASHTAKHGAYGASFFAIIPGHADRIWLGRPWINDLKFRVEHDDHSEFNAEYESRRANETKAQDLIRHAMLELTDIQAATDWVKVNTPHTSLGGLVAEQASYYPSSSSLVERFIDHLSRSGLSQLAGSTSNSYGLRELVFATPEGPHAAAGGLAQVITGLPRELTRLGIPVSIISPLYHHKHGNKHRSADDVIRNGFNLNGQRVVPRYVTTLSLAIGPTRHAGTGWNKRPPSTLYFSVYLAEHGDLRVFLLANSGVFDRLYQPVYADEQLRRAIVLSRAVLETIACQQLSIRPSAIISNDWMTACVPALCALDPRYRSVSWLRDAKTIHMIHNGGADYHGRLPLNFYNEDLWPLFNLAPEHYFGFRDPHRPELLNLTMAAAQHSSGGVITVSQPYARDLLTPTGGEGLEHVLARKRASVFGISNGINREEINNFLKLHLNLNEEQLSDPATLLAAKSHSRAKLQQRLGLAPDPHAALISFVGRLAEQKGLSLLSGYVAHSPRSTLEEILIRHPASQIVVAGPITPGDTSAQAISDTLHYLRARYPGRVAFISDYISHSTALEIISASQLFLMPSRFEPGGITQLEALAAGTLVVARNVGGISATISNYDQTSGSGTGFVCDAYEPGAFANTIDWALKTCQDHQIYNSLVKQAINARHAWSDRAPAFAAVVQRMVLGEATQESLPFLDSQRALSQSCAAI